MTINALVAALLIVGSVAPAMAQGHDHRGHMQHARPGARGTEAPATRDFKAAHGAMMKAMDLPYTGDPDVDFRVHMIPHHQGAIAMARVALNHATDPWTRQLAESVIIEQQREIAEMQAWLATRGAAVPPGGQPRQILDASSYRKRNEEPGTRGEAAGQSWAPSSPVRP